MILLTYLELLSEAILAEKNRRVYCTWFQHIPLHTDWMYCQHCSGDISVLSTDLCCQRNFCQ